ncbi:MAG: OmpA family protein [Myxococcota bacterium]
MWIALWTATANAQVPVPELNSQLFRPSLDSRYTLWTNDSTRQATHTLLGRVMFHYTKDPLTHYGPNGEVTRVISDVVQADIAGGYQLGAVRIGLDVPVMFYADGAGSPSQSGFGDLALDVKGTVLERADAPVGLAFLGRLSFPTGNLPGLTSGNPAAEIEAIVDQDLGEKVFLGANLGFRAIPDAGLENWTDNVYARVGLGYKTTDRSGFSGELISHGVTKGPGLPSEVLLGGWGRAAKDLHMRGGVGTALGRGIGTPQLRAMFGLAFEPTFEPDKDADGITDFDDACPTVAEDPDGVEDLDGCPEATKVTVRVVDADGAALEAAEFEIEPSGTKGKSGEVAGLFGGAYRIRVVAEGYDPEEPTVQIQDTATQEVSITLQKTITTGTLVLQVLDLENQPIEGSTWSARGTDFKDVVVTAEGTELPIASYDLRVEAPGFRPQRVSVSVPKGETARVSVQLAPAKVELKAERIIINESVYFELNKATIKEESFPLLDEVSAVIKDHPELLKIRIEGHTDSRGSASANKLLSQKRAESVRDYMVGKGVAVERLEAVGFGEEKPLDKANNEAAWTKNRRVDFFVAERSD